MPSIGHDEILAIPWLLPGLGASILVAVLLNRPVGRALRTGPHLGWSLIVGLGIVLSATLTPSAEALEMGLTGIRACDLSRLWPASLEEILRLRSAGLNILLFVPLGAAIGLLPRARRKAVVIAAAAALPFAIEAVQMLVVPLDRACQSADIIDNLVGLTLGLLVGTAAGRVAPSTRHGWE